MTTATVNVRALKARIARLVKASIADAWKEGGPPEDIPYIEEELKLARRSLNDHIGEGELKAWAKDQIITRLIEEAEQLRDKLEYACDFLGG